jgi:glycosyltransferase involved in cell wall biosynthesis
MNLGGPAHHVTLLSARLAPERYETLLVKGHVRRGEESFEELARRYGVRLRTIGSLGPEIRPLADLRAVIALVRLIREFRPDIVHTHTAKAGLLGRTAAMLAIRPRPIIVHTYHGHVLENYFGPARNALYRSLERALAKTSDCLIGVSQATVEDLVRLRIGPREKFRVVPVGLDLAPFLELRPEDGSSFRIELGVGADDVLLVYVGRLEPIKRLDVMLKAFARARGAAGSLSLAIVGDGDSRHKLERLSEELKLAPHVHFLGYRRDMEAIVAGGDVAILTSDNEGTPVFLIEAAAGGRPGVATSVGGVPEIVNEETGVLVRPGDENGLSAAIVRLSRDSALRAGLGRQARERVRERYRSSRLVDDIDAVYRELLQRRSCFSTSRPRGAWRG